jgi:hypothetical protein
MIRDEGDLREALCRRRDAMGVTNQWLDRFVGVPDGYTSKLLCNPPMKGMSVRTLFWFAGAMGFALALPEDPQPFERIQGQVVLRKLASNYGSPKHAPVTIVHRRSFLRKIGLKGALKRKANFDAAAAARRKLSRINRAKALNRWRKPQIKEVK